MAVPEGIRMGAQKCAGKVGDLVPLLGGLPQRGWTATRRRLRMVDRKISSNFDLARRSIPNLQAGAASGRRRILGDPAAGESHFN